MNFLSSMIGGATKPTVNIQVESKFKKQKCKFEKQFNTKLFFLVHGKNSSWSSWFSGYDNVSWKDAKHLMDYLRSNSNTEPEFIENVPRQLKKPSLFSSGFSEPKETHVTTKSSDDEIVIEEPYNGRIDIVMHTNGGDLQSTHIMIKLLLNYQNIRDSNKIHVWIPYRSQSAGTAIAMTADYIHMYPSGFMGQIDPQYWYGIAVSDFTQDYWLNLDQQDQNDRIQMTSWIGDLYRFVSRSALRVYKDWKLLIDEIGDQHKWTPEQMVIITEELLKGKYYHGKPLFENDMKQILPNITLYTDEDSKAWEILFNVFQVLEELDKDKCNY